jgi:hypothetical protein
MPTDDVPLEDKQEQSRPASNSEPPFEETRVEEQPNEVDPADAQEQRAPR